MVQKLAFVLSCILPLPALAQDSGEVAYGPLFSKFDLTLSLGSRNEAAGPLYYSQESGSQRQWALPPFYCYTRTPDVDWTESDIIYPIISYRRFGGQYRFQFVQLFSFSGGQSFDENGVRLFTIFPFYFQQRAPDTNLNYTALLPFYGELKNRLFRDDIKFVMFPLYSETRKKDVVTDNYLYPFFDLRHGDGLKGWQFWPVFGVEHKVPTQSTNMLEVVETVGGFDKYFAAWPFYTRNRTGLGTTNVQTSLTVAPFYSHTQSPERNETSYGWPLGYNAVDDRKKNFVEHDFIWPLFVFAQGEKRITRIFPFYSQSHISGAGSFPGFFDLSPATNAPPPAPSDLESDFYLWPVYKFNRMATGTFERRRSRVLFFLYSDIHETNSASGDHFHRADFWPFYTYHREVDGNQRWQAPALLEPFFPNNRSLTREYSQLWSFWRSEKNHKTGASSQSLFWNLYRREATRQSRNFSLLFGLFQYQSGEEGSRWRVCHLTVAKKAAQTAAPKS